MNDVTASPAIDLTLSRQAPMPGRWVIQPHGALLAVRADQLTVTHASANLRSFLDCTGRQALGRPLQALIGEAACAMLPNSGPTHGVAVGTGQVMTLPDGRLLHLNAYVTGRHVCIDIEPIKIPTATLPNTAPHHLLQTFALANSPAELCERAVVGLKALTGYDRVMACRFHPDEHGEVIAEAREAGMESYLGLHWSADELPARVRRLILRQRVGAIADTGGTPVPLLMDPALDRRTPLDLTNSNLRGASPAQREYLRNMGAAAVATVALVTGAEPNGPLWGVLICQHRTSRVVEPQLRATFALVGQVTSLLLRSLAEVQTVTRQHVREASLSALSRPLSCVEPVEQAVAAVEHDLLGLVDAAGVAVRIGGATVCLGLTPPSDAVGQVLNVLLDRARNDVLAFDDIPLRFPTLDTCRPFGSGALLLPLGTTGDAVLWFRPEQWRDVTWKGDPVERGCLDPTINRLSPRASFAAWKEGVRGRATPWERADLRLARALREVVEAAVADRVKADLARLRHYDPLTGLANRSLLQDRMKDAESQPDKPMSLLFLDLDHFKAVNDTMGHAAGDALLIEVARRLESAVGPDHLAARLGGDEFVVLCQGIEPEMLEELADRVRQAVERPFDIGGRPCHISASIGIAAADQSFGLDLVRAADLAMYVAKQAGGNRGVRFDPTLLDRAIMKFEMEQDMRAALAAGDQFVLLYQPIFALTDGRRRLLGFESLVRWKHPQLGWASPAGFMAMAEKSGLIMPLGDWVLATALRQGNALRRAHPAADLIIHVNVSALQIPRPGFRDSIAGALESEGYPPSGLCLEVTESMLTDGTAATVLEEIRALGVDIAIDDFGMGYSSLSYLRRLPVDVIKLDRSFLEDVESDPHGAEFVGAVIALAHAAGKPVVFEGVETQSQLDLVLSVKADAVQGFFFAPPLSANAAEAMAAEHRLLDERTEAA